MKAYLNGHIIEEGDAKVSVRDRGYMLGDAVFEVWRSYGGRPHEPMVEKNLARLARGLQFMELDPADIIADLRRGTAELVVQNADEIKEVGDVLFFVIVSRGMGMELGSDAESTTRSIVCIPMPFQQFGRDLHRRGGKLTTSLLYQDPWGAVDPRIKTTSRMGYVRAERKMKRTGPATWVVFSDGHGNVTEASGANLMLIKDGVIHRPPRERVLGGINQDTFLELAAKIGINNVERNLTLYDYLESDEVVLTTTSVSAIPINEFDGITLTRRSNIISDVQKEWVNYVGFDFMQQANQFQN